MMLPHDAIGMGVARFDEIMGFATEKMQTRAQTLPFLPISVFMYAFPLFSGKAEGNIAQFARGFDYHDAVFQRVQCFEQTLATIYPNGQFKALKNAWPLPAVQAGRMAGLGFVGRHGLLIMPPYGTFVAFGAVIADFVVPYSTPQGSCEGCNACLEACPTQALTWQGSSRLLQRERCLSFITQSKQDDNQALLHAAPYVWGCDICQNVCPHNASPPLSTMTEVIAQPIATVTLATLATPDALQNRHYTPHLSRLMRNLLSNKR